MIEVDPQFERDVQSLRRDLGRLGREIEPAVNKEIREALKPIVEDARRRYDHRYGRRTGKGRRSIRAAATKRRAAIIAGRRKVPYVYMQEYGGRTDAGRARLGPSRSEGNFYRPAVQKGVRQLVAHDIPRQLDRLTRKAGYR